MKRAAPAPDSDINRPACPECGTVVDADEVEGFCPVCLLGEARSTPGRTPPSIPDPAELDALVEDFEILDLIGAGGMGAVYRARQLNLHREVALKLLTLDPEDPLNFAERFHREARAMAALNHPHIITVYDFGETAGGRFFFTMEHIDGTDLRRISQETKVDQSDAFRWIRQIGEALRYAHEQGVIHRDLKPSNILVTARGDAKIGDFGLAKLNRGEDTAPGDGEEITDTQLTMGTPEYAAPEQVSRKGGPVDHRSDLFSLGVICYELLTSERPRGSWEPPSTRSPGLSSAVDRMVDRLLKRERDDRYRDASEFLEDLGKIDRRRNASTRHRSRVKRAVLIGGTAAALLTAGFLAKEQLSRERPVPTATPEVTIAVQHHKRINFVDSMPESGRVVAVSDDGTVLFPADPEPNPEPAKVPSLKLTRTKAALFDEDRLIISDNSNSLVLYDSSRREIVQRFAAGDNRTFLLIPSKNRRSFLRFRAYESSWWHYRIDQAEPIRSFSAPANQQWQVYACAFLSDGEHFVYATGTGDRFKKNRRPPPSVITLARLDRDEPVATFGESKEGYRTLVLTPDNRTLIAGGLDGAIHRFSLADLTAPEWIDRTPTSHSRINDLAWLPGAKVPTVITTSGDRPLICFHATRSMREIHRIDLVDFAARGFAVDPAKRTLYFHGLKLGSKLGDFHTRDKSCVYRVAIPERLFAPD